MNLFLINKAHLLEMNKNKKNILGSRTTNCIKRIDLNRVKRFSNKPLKCNTSLQYCPMKTTNEYIAFVKYSLIDLFIDLVQLLQLFEYKKRLIEQMNK